MTFEQWMEEMSRVTLAPREEGTSIVLNKLNDLIPEDFEEDETSRNA